MPDSESAVVAGEVALDRGTVGNPAPGIEHEADEGAAVGMALKLGLVDDQLLD